MRLCCKVSDSRTKGRARAHVRRHFHCADCLFHIPAVELGNVVAGLLVYGERDFYSAYTVFESGNVDVVTVYHAVFEGKKRNGAIHRAAVYIYVSDFFCEGFCHRAFSA